MLLAIDAGNTNVVLGVYEGMALRHRWRLTTDRRKTADEYGLQLVALLAHNGLLSAVRDVVIACVVPPLLPVLRAMCREYLRVEPLVVTADLDLGLAIRYERPQDAGADRLVNAVAAQKKYGLPAIVVDFGTATKFEAVASDGTYLGGAIAPGLAISAEALFQHAAKLPRIHWELPPHVIGHNTMTAMQAGLLWGAIGAVEAIVGRMRQELGRAAPAIATGGLAELVAAHCPSIATIDPDLTLDGLRCVWERNRPPTPAARDQG